MEMIKPIKTKQDYRLALKTAKAANRLFVESRLFPKQSPS
jgi:hypothetical protein